MIFKIISGTDIQEFIEELDSATAAFDQALKGFRQAPTVENSWLSLRSRGFIASMDGRPCCVCVPTGGAIGGQLMASAPSTSPYGRGHFLRDLSRRAATAPSTGAVDGKRRGERRAVHAPSR